MARFTSAITALSAVTATATSQGFEVGDRKKLSLQVVAASITSGNAVFTVLVSNDGANYVAYNRLITNATKTNTQADVGVASVTLSSNTSAFMFFPVGDHFRYIKVVATVTTDGAYSAFIHAVD